MLKTEKLKGSLQGAQASRLCCPYATGETRTRAGRLPVLPVLLIVALLAFAIPHPSFAITYTDWIAQFSSLTGEAAAPAADPDNDGLANLLEYALDGLDPTVMNSRDGVTACYQQTRNEDGSYNAPALALTKAQRAAAASLHAVLRWKPRGGIEGVVFVPQTSQKDLQCWGWGDSAVTEWEADGYRWARADSDALVWKDRAFVRLRIEMR